MKSDFFICIQYMKEFWAMPKRARYWGVRRRLRRTRFFIRNADSDDYRLDEETTGIKVVLSVMDDPNS
jgi:hypothetical protein